MSIWPASALLISVAWSNWAMVTLIPAFAASSLMSCASALASGSVVVPSVTLNWPPNAALACATSFWAFARLYAG